MDYIEDPASLGAGAEAKDDAQAEIDAYNAETLSIHSEPEESVGTGSRHGPDADLVQPNVPELSEAVINTNTAKTYSRYSHPTLAPTFPS
jgi:hypothetical protein